MVAGKKVGGEPENPRRLAMAIAQAVAEAAAAAAAAAVATAYGNRSRMSSRRFPFVVIFCPFSEAVHEHPDLIKKYRSMKA